MLQCWYFGASLINSCPWVLLTMLTNISNYMFICQCKKKGDHVAHIKWELLMCGVVLFPLVRMTHVQCSKRSDVVCCGHSCGKCISAKLRNIRLMLSFLPEHSETEKLMNQGSLFWCQISMGPRLYAFILCWLNTEVFSDWVRYFQIRWGHQH